MEQFNKEFSKANLKTVSSFTATPLCPDANNPIPIS